MVHMHGHACTLVLIDVLNHDGYSDDSDGSHEDGADGEDDDEGGGYDDGADDGDDLVDSDDIHDVDATSVIKWRC